MTELEKERIAWTYDDCIMIADIAFEPCGRIIADKLRRRKHQILECPSTGECACK
jgi:hypothetical protein